MDRENEARQAGLNSIAGRILRFFGDRVAACLAPFPIHPNAVTLIAFAIGLLGAYQGTQGTSQGFLLCSLLLALSSGLDFADGSLARRKNLSSRLGAYLDSTCDDLIDFISLGCLAIGLHHAGCPFWWAVTPIFAYGADVVIALTMTRYRTELIDSRKQPGTIEATFRASPLLQIGRNLLPPLFLRQLLFPCFAIFGWASQFIIGYSIYSVILAFALFVKTGMDISRNKTS